MTVVEDLKKTAQTILRFRMIIGWQREYIAFNGRNLVDQQHVLAVPTGKTLIVVPHADDEIFGGYAFIKQHLNTELYYMGFTGSNQSTKNRRKRKREFVISSQQLNVRYYCVEEISLIDLLKSNDYKNVLCPAIVDWHPEHRICSKLLMDAVLASGNFPNIYWYSVTVPIMASKKLTLIPMTKKMQREKYYMFKKIYKSQSFMPVERFKYQERINAFDTGAYACESLCKVLPDELKACVDLLYGGRNKETLNQELDDLKKSISNLRTIRIASQAIYKKMKIGD